MAIPSKVKPGDPIRAADWNHLIDYLRSAQVQPGSGVRMTRGPSGVTLAASVRPGTVRQSFTQPFELAIVNDSEGAQPQWKVRVYTSTLAGDVPEGFSAGDEPPYLLDAEEGIVLGGITINGEGGVTSRWIEIQNEMPQDQESTFYVRIGSLAQDGDTWRAVNERFGPIDAQICRNWFVSPTRFGVSWS